MGNKHQAEQIHGLKQTECKTHPELSMIAQEEIISHSGHKKFGNQTQIQRRVFIIKLYLVSMPEDLLYMNALRPVWSRLYRVLICSGFVTKWVFSHYSSKSADVFCFPKVWNRFVACGAHVKSNSFLCANTGAESRTAPNGRVSG